MEKNTKVLLGATKDNEIVFANVRIDHPYYYSKALGRYTDETISTLSISFDLVKPFMANNLDLTQLFEDYNEGFDKADLYDLCKHYACSPQGLAEHQAAECGDVRDVIDCSLYNQMFNLDGDEWYFESSSCGQHDTRHDMKQYVSRLAYDGLLKLWDEYHLKPITELTMDYIDKLLNLLDVDQELWIKRFIMNNYEDLSEYSVM